MSDFTPTAEDITMIRATIRAIRGGDNEAAFTAADAYAAEAIMSDTRFELLTVTMNAIRWAQSCADAVTWFDPAAKAAHLADLARIAA